MQIVPQLRVPSLVERHHPVHACERGRVVPRVKLDQARAQPLLVWGELKRRRGWLRRIGLVLIVRLRSRWCPCCLSGRRRRCRCCSSVFPPRWRCSRRNVAPHVGFIQQTYKARRWQRCQQSLQCADKLAMLIAITYLAAGVLLVAQDSRAT